MDRERDDYTLSHRRNTPTATRARHLTTPPAKHAHSLTHKHVHSRIRNRFHTLTHPHIYTQARAQHAATTTHTQNRVGGARPPARLLLPPRRGPGYVARWRRERAPAVAIFRRAAADAATRSIGRARKAAPSPHGFSRRRSRTRQPPRLLFIPAHRRGQDRTDE